MVEGETPALAAAWVTVRVVIADRLHSGGDLLT